MITDQPAVRIESTDMQYFDTVDDIVGRSIAAGDPLIALEYVQKLQREGMLKGLAIAKMFFRLRQSWDLFRTSGTDDEFENVVESTTGYSRATINKYLDLWENIFENDALSDDLKTKLAGKPMEILLRLSSAAKEGSLSGDDWNKVAESSNIQEVRAQVRERRGDRTSSKLAKIPSIFWRETGTHSRGELIITVDGEQKTVGHLELDSPDDDVQKYIAKIINILHVFEVF